MPKKCQMNLHSIQEAKNLRIQLPPYDSSPEIKELADLQTVQYPENPSISISKDGLKQEFSVETLLCKLDYKDQ